MFFKQLEGFFLTFLTKLIIKKR